LAINLAANPSLVQLRQPVQSAAGRRLARDGDQAGVAADEGSEGQFTAPTVVSLEIQAFDEIVGEAVMFGRREAGLI